MTFKERYQYNPKTDLVGKGGFSKVYRAYDTVLHRTVALKVFTNTATEKYDLVSEISRVIALEHPNLCRFYDVAFIEGTNSMGEEEEMQVGIMEYMDGGDIKTFTKQHPEHLKSLLIDVLQGLAHLHENGIIHRDLKPANILIKNTPKGPIAKITDFGISKETDTENTSNSSVLMGTIEYMAPEQFNPRKYGINGKIGTNLDLWSFAMLVYELVEGKQLFGSRNDGSSAEQMMNNILGDIDVTLFDNLPHPYQRIVKHGLIKDAKIRIQKAEALIRFMDTRIEDRPLAFDEQLKKNNREEGTQVIIDQSGKLVKEKVSDTSGKETTKKKSLLLWIVLGVGVIAVLGLFVFNNMGILKLPIAANENNLKDTAQITGIAKPVNKEVNQTIQQASTPSLTTQPNNTKPENKGLETNSALPTQTQTQNNGVNPQFQTQNNQQPIENEPITTTQPNGANNGRTVVLVAANNPAIINNSEGQNKVLEPEMIAVQGGTFAMGSNGSAPDEKMHTVTISDFKMSKYEITQAIWIAIMGNNPSAHTGCNNCPVERVSWEMLPEFIFKLNMQTGKNYRLPTEAEWEYAATGGIKTNSYKYAGNNTVDAIGWYNENSNKNTHEVGQKQPNELGLYDMTGNVWEWCSDWYGNDYYAHSPSKNPKGGINGTRKVCRGGSYNSEAIKCHNTLRNGMPPYQRKEMGFRLVLQQ